MLLRVLMLAAFTTSTVTPIEAAEQSIGDKGRGIVSTPTPTPHRKKKSRKKRSPSASPVRVKKKTASPSPNQEEEKSPPSPIPSETVSLPTPAPSAAAASTSTVSPSPGQMPASQKSVLPQNKSGGAPNVALLAEAITNFESYPSKVQKLLASALELTTSNLDYKYGSADPANGGMDCSGFVYYVLKQNGVAPYVPADCKDQYTWLRSAGTFEPVFGGKDDSFELNKLQPGDLLFWSGPYSTERDPPITEAMIYLGREKRTGVRLMVGASDGRTYESQQRFGVSVFEFKMPQTENSKAYERQECLRFLGYGHIPFLNE
jgi:cell wall-associated NlpC family hydrolase